ncbi:heparan N-sulfatase [Euzebyella marina]|uniref:Heparan N-sulfatase n=1 Tax=Euzebyella marina TaxID=1761453 RepID=A0A3G2LBH7_9FLAO|nr:sulfatase [Euzebyella marina]AYN69609.1 heparan N-sulfatase [Euzebyella marina]
MSIGINPTFDTIPPNIIVFIADDISWNDFGCYGNKDVQTPNIDGLAEGGLRFDNAILTTSSCSPSRISIMTGRYPHNTGAAELHTEPKRNFSSIASQLKNKGYHTGQAGKWHMGDLLRNGFDVIHDNGKANGDGGEDMWLPALKDRDKSRPFFFWFASMDAHRPWGANNFSGTHLPETVEVPKTLVNDGPTKIDIARYYDEIKRFDHHIGQVVTLLKKEGQYDNTLILIMADNGRPFPRDKTRMYDSGLKTPFIAHWPNKIKKGVSKALISIMDLAPTILEVCGAETPKSFQGRSFKKLLTNPAASFRNYAFGEHNWHDHEAHERVIRTSEYLYILNSRPKYANQGPADALKSPSFQALKQEKIDGSLTEAQNDVFLKPRSMEELFKLSTDTNQYDNLLGNNTYQDIHITLRTILEKWMIETGDSIPDNLTGDWYTRDDGSRIEEGFQTRGVMPGLKHKADLIDASGPF